MSVDEQLQQTSDELAAAREVVKKYQSQRSDGYITGAAEALQASPACLDNCATPSAPPAPVSELERWQQTQDRRFAEWLSWYGSETKKWPESGREEAKRLAAQREAARLEMEKETFVQKLRGDVDRAISMDAWLKEYHRDLQRLESEAQQTAAQRKWQITLQLADGGESFIEQNFRAGVISEAERADALNELKGRQQANTTKGPTT